MFRISLSTFRERWQLFVGSILMAGFGVALVQSSLLILVSAATFDAPAGLSTIERAHVLDSFVLAIPVIGITLALAVFLTVFIISSTFAFTVAQRKRDLALMRLTGGSRQQLRRLLLGEATLLGLIGTALGVPLGLVFMRLQTWLLIKFGFLPALFHPEWKYWVLAASLAIGVGVALLGVLVASRRAGRIRPLEALQDTGNQARVMTPSRWILGVLALAIAAGLLTVSQSVDAADAMPLMMLTTLATALGLSALSPLIVPVFGRILARVLPHHAIGNLAASNIRDGVRRSASMAAPLIVLIGLVTGLLGTSMSSTAASQQALRAETSAELVATSAPDDARRISQMPGVTGTSVEGSRSLVMLNADHEDLGGDLTPGTARVVDPADYRRAHQTEAEAGSLAALHGQAVALGPGRSGELGYSLGDTVRVQIGERKLQLPVVAVLPMKSYGGSDLLLPKEIASDPSLAPESAQTFITTASGADPRQGAEDIQAAGPGSVDTVDAWVHKRAAAEQNAQLRIFTVLLGMASLYALFAAINAVVISAADRRSDFAAARLSGLTRTQVLKMALLESETVTSIGVLLGGVAAGTTVLGMRAALQRMTGIGAIELPWLAIGGLVATAFIAVGITSLWTAWSATRTKPIMLITSD